METIHIQPVEACNKMAQFFAEPDRKTDPKNTLIFRQNCVNQLFVVNVDIVCCAFGIVFFIVFPERYKMRE